MECYASKKKILGWLTVAGAMAILAYLTTTSPELVTKIVGGFGVVFFGFGFLLFTIQLLNWGPIVVINDTGIEDRRLRIGFILWEDIIAVSSYALGGGDGVLHLTVKHPEKYLSRMRWWKFNVAETCAPIQIKFFAFTPDLEEALKYIQFRRCDHAWNEAEERHEESNPNGQFSKRDP